MRSQQVINHSAAEYLYEVKFIAIHEDGSITEEREYVTPQVYKTAKSSYYAAKYGYKQVIVNADPKLLQDLHTYLLTLKEGK